LIEALAWYGDATMIDDVRERFVLMVKSPDAVPPDLRPVVVRVAGRYADAATWEKMHALARQAIRTEEKRMYYDGMQRALDPKLATQTMEISLTDEMRPAEKNQNLARVAEARDGDRLVWEFFLAHDDKLMSDIDGFRRHRYIPSTMGNSADPVMADELLNYMRNKRSGDPTIEAERAAERVRYRGELRDRAVADIDAWVATRKAAQPLH
jgi:aminopeptidase N